jgi:hypothetical protein
MDEGDLIERIRRQSRGGRSVTLGIGDDCAIFRPRVAIQLNGARGYSKDTIAEWVYRAARAARLVDGADEVHKMVLAKFMREEGRDFWTWSAGNRV